MSDDNDSVSGNPELLRFMNHLAGAIQEYIEEHGPLSAGDVAQGTALVALAGMSGGADRSIELAAQLYVRYIIGIRPVAVGFSSLLEEQNGTVFFKVDAEAVENLTGDPAATGFVLVRELFRREPQVDPKDLN